MVSLKSFVNETLLTQAEFNRRKDTLNREMEKDFNSKQKELANKVGEEYRAERDASKDIIWANGNYKPTKKWTAINDFPVSSIPASSFDSTRKKIKKAQEFYPELAKKYLDFLDLWQPKVDELLGLKSSIGKKEVLSPTEKKVKELKQLNYDKTFESVIDAIAEKAFERFQEYAKKHNKENKNTLQDIKDNLHNVRVKLAETFKEFKLAEIDSGTLVTVRNGDVNGIWKITNVDGEHFILNIDTNLAGGWNIQKLHTRTKVSIKKV